MAVHNSQSPVRAQITCKQISTKPSRGLHKITSYSLEKPFSNPPLRRDRGNQDIYRIPDGNTTDHTAKEKRQSSRRDDVGCL